MNKNYLLSLIALILILLVGCASVITHSIDYPASDDLFITVGDDPGTESTPSYIPKGQFVHITQESYLFFPIFGIFIKFGNADPPIVFDKEVIPKIRSMGGDALIGANISYIPASPWFDGILGLRAGAKTVIIGQVVKRPETNMPTLQTIKDHENQFILENTNTSETNQNMLIDLPQNSEVNIDVQKTSPDENSFLEERPKDKINVNMSNKIEQNYNEDKDTLKIPNSSNNSYEDLLCDEVHSNIVTQDMLYSTNNCYLSIIIEGKSFVDNEKLAVELDNYKFLNMHEFNNTYDIIFLKKISIGKHIINVHYNNKSRSIPINIQENIVTTIEIEIRKPFFTNEYLAGIESLNIDYNVSDWYYQYKNKKIFLVGDDK